MRRNSCMQPAILFAIGTFFLGTISQIGAAAIAQEPQRVEFQPNGIPASYAFKGVELTSDQGDTLRYYFHASSDQNAPVVVFVPGSGCDGAVKLDRNGNAKGGIDLFAGKYSPHIQVLTLEAPGIPRYYASAHPGSATECPASYFKYSDYKKRLASYAAVLDDARRQGMLKSNRVMFIGVSEGVEFAADLATLIPETTAITLISGFGPNQLFDSINNALGTWQERVADSGELIKRTRETIHDWQAILDDPTSNSKFYRGHPYARWSSTGLRSSVDVVSKLPDSVHIYLVHGGRDTSMSPAGFEFGVSTLISQRKQFAFQFIPCADHELKCDGDVGEPKNLITVIHRSIDWLLEGKMDYDDIVVVDK
jgi:predicted esterase